LRRLSRPLPSNQIEEFPLKQRENTRENRHLPGPLPEFLKLTPLGVEFSGVLSIEALCGLDCVLTLFRQPISVRMALIRVEMALKWCSNGGNSLDIALKRPELGPEWRQLGSTWRVKVVRACLVL